MTGLPLLLSVPGIPRPGGSKRGFPIKRANGTVGVAMTDASGEKGKDWRTLCKVLARQEYAAEPTRDLLAIRLVFVLPRPKSHFRTGKHAGELRTDAPYWAGKKPDATKLLRSIEDALTGIVWVDDAQIVDQSVSKVYGDRPGAYLIVEEVGADQEAAVMYDLDKFMAHPTRRTA